MNSEGLQAVMVKMSSEHTMVTALSAAVVIIALIAALYYVNHYKKQCTTGGTAQKFGMNPQWQYGSADAGVYGSMGRPSTKYHVATSHAGSQHATRWARGHPGYEGLAAAPAPGIIGGRGTTSPCGPGQVMTSYQDPSGAMLSVCQDSGMVTASGCGRPWDGAAIAEAQALATVGSYQHDSYGEAELQKVINQAYDSDRGLSDDSLNTLMQNGGIP